MLPVLRFADTSEAIRRANASSYGLGASVWGRDVAKAAEAHPLAQQCRAGHRRDRRRHRCTSIGVK